MELASSIFELPEQKEVLIFIGIMVIILFFNRD